ncbi:MBL fold metallo-hydrolase [Clostridium sporogenes]|nr:MBL fold metallo-hydrolase [Clostridium sporogenes]UAL59906.1 MBL fold metallo-hydrolase [Clostridium sporogenes]
MEQICLKIFQVKAGDCISLRYKGFDEKYHNIFIDCGYSGTFDKTLDKEIIGLKSRKERIDLFVLTHTHQDHIGGISKFIKKYGEDDIVDQFWFNGGRLLINFNISSKISVNQGFELEKYLIKTKKCNTEKIVYKIKEHEIYGAEIKVIGPTIETLDKFLNTWNKDYSIFSEKITTQMCDWNIDIADFDLDKFEEDSDEDNKSSIAFIVYINNTYDKNSKKILFLGDAFPNQIAQNLSDMGYSEENRLNLDYVKISHHGSKGNTSDNLLDIIDCSKFIISTNGTNRDKFPHKETFARILRHPLRDKNKKIKFIFNYDTVELRSIFKEYEYGDFNFECSYPEKGDNHNAILI